eukprot:CAMPEP_0198109788 /NCGR_PEP_ID=MMETSP1442-20131203/1835_1 /TAXON_ID= /ORGANISM="Craspedostauros australis, Strain CCMP3328" /LENGTH=340 /DNA_ID=CAMNT_0043765587 /DNA_START=282 /DNA_END=1304 /DNA_ORIENTATION=-
MTRSHRRMLQSSTASPARYEYQPPSWLLRYVTKDPTYFLNCAAGGIISAGVMHTFVTPLDVIKCSMQANPQKYSSIRNTFQTILKEEGSMGLWKGWGPTLTAYSSQGAIKFAGYELFKDIASNAMSEEDAYKYRNLIYVSSGAAAELLADVFMCPWEMVKVKVQTSPQGTFPLRFGPALQEMYMNRAETRFPFGSLQALWGRQIPFAMAKFGLFEACVEGFYTNILTEPKDTYGKPTQLAVTFCSGYVTGIVCGVISHPADTMVSLMGKSEHKGKTMMQIAQEVGYINLLTNGLGSRLLMVGTLTGLQWWAYDTFKTTMGMGTTGGVSIGKQHAHHATSH